MNLYISKYIFILLLFCWSSASAQQQSKLDSLKEVFSSEPGMRTNAGHLLEMAKEETSPDSILKYSGLAIENFKSSDSIHLLQDAYRTHGAYLREKGEYDKSLNFLFKAAELAEERNDLTDLGRTNIEIGNTYSESGNYQISATYFDRGLDFLRESDDTLSLGRALYNLGDALILKEQMDPALRYIQEAREIFRHYEKKLYEAYAIGNLGIIYAFQGDSRRGERYLNEAIDMLEEVEDYNAVTDFLFSMAEIYSKRGDYKGAINFAERSLEAAESHNLKADLDIVHLMLSNLYDEVGNTSEAFTHFKEHITYRDNIRNVQTVEEMANLRTDFEVARKQTEVDLLNEQKALLNEQKANQRNIVIATAVALFLIILLAIGLYRRNQYIGRTKKIIESEKNRSDRLLLNILPQETAIELKENGKVQAKRFDAATVLFTDFKNFTHFAENLPPEELVKSVDFYFSKFDEICEHHGLEKIKTVGDAYMCAAGVPFPVEDHAARIVRAACDMIHFVNDAKTLQSPTETRFEMRIGVNSGPVVAGVVGSKKWAYDIWGDTVNIAARMEGCSETGRINISENTYHLIRNEFECDYRGEIEVKNKGMMKMYFIKDKKSVISSDFAREEVLKM